ncbi:hypothetical protein [Salibacterium qingdaonense]|uniref:hypothetical protein n=1 Tax=Salibacterium qingdaonense TaxID=266892 RepID=UPI000B872A12|nr:hypothetical protein [Salibacterium qingdaonense]
MIEKLENRWRINQETRGPIDKSGKPIEKGAQAAPFPEAGQGFAGVKLSTPESMQKSGASIEKSRESIKKNRKWGKTNREKAESINKSGEPIEKGLQLLCFRKRGRGSLV